ncbi:hypothetical protein H4R20_004568, partial [Coemansia guatemalensis]
MDRLMDYRDKRMGVINEVIAGIQSIKLYAWELPFVKRIGDIREKLELACIRKYGILQVVSLFSTTLLSFMVSFATFGIYSLVDNVSHGPLTPQLVFVSLVLFDMIKGAISSTNNNLPKLLRTIASFTRVYNILTADEINPDSVTRKSYDRSSAESTLKDTLVDIEAGSFKWLSVGNPILENINVKCKKNELIAVIGRVGSGKSSLVSAILGDMIKHSGDVTVRGSIAYVAQQPWILNATLRDNILFGSNYDQEFYNQVIDACALRQDIDMLSAGDVTEIGERGINLSGGQKMRVSLARAVYARADIYILDDPLAA